MKPILVIPAKAGIQLPFFLSSALKLDSRFRGNDERESEC